MKGNKIIKICFLVGSILFASLSCTREELDNRSWEETDRVPVSLSLSIAKMEAGTPETKAIMEPDINSPTLEQQVKNFVVLQFEGEGTAAKLMTLPTYYKDADNVFDGTEQVRLLPTTKPSVIVVVANTYDNIYAQSGMTLDQFLQMDYSRMAGYNAVFTRDLDGNDYIRMSGVTEKPSIDTNTPVEITLKRNVSKITINVKNTMPDNADKVTLKQAQLRDINTKYYYLTNIDSFHDEYSPTDPYRIDKETEDLPEPNADGSYTFTYYVPANLRGTNGSTAQYSKPLGAPEGATRFCLYGTYGSSNTGINYTYYLGEDLEKDFNLKPNYHYTYNITLKSKGDARYDYRIEDCKEVKFKVDANCYMVQPPIGQNQEQIYAIPVRRAAVFWNKPADGINGTYGANNGTNYSSYVFTDGTLWNARILWSDFDLRDYFENPADFLYTKSGKGLDPSSPTQSADFNPYLKIKVKEGMKGNVVIGVEYEGAIVWSWHIWITDYNPDREALVSASETYIYGVEGGNVHRYNNTAFNDNDKMFIMDRNLGASGTSYAGLNGTMYYQFGRKDPFVGYSQNGDMDTYYTYNDGSVQTKTGMITVERDATGQGSQNVRYTITNPTTFITSNEGWTLNDVIGPNLSTWLDGKYTEHTGNQQILETNKSIYDPCPPGWKVPDKAVFEHVKDTPKNNIAKEGLYYNPVGNVSIFFPMHGYRDDTGIMWNVNIHGRLWSSTAAESNQAYRLYYYNNSGVKDINVNSIVQSYAMPVRCVREGAYVRENYIAD